MAVAVHLISGVAVKHACHRGCEARAYISQNTVKPHSRAGHGYLITVPSVLQDIIITSPALPVPLAIIAAEAACAAKDSSMDNPSFLQR